MASAEILAPPSARDLFARMRGRRILVVGDLMVDEWIWGSVSRISPEAPVPVVAVREHTFTLGGAGNVASNLRALGAHVTFVGVVGDDAEGKRAEELCETLQVDAASLLHVQDRPTTRKTRVVAHAQQVVRADWESTTALELADRDRVAAEVARHAASSDGVVLSDYAKGLFSRNIVEAALAAPVVVADPKPANIALFGGVTCVAPNAAEAFAMAGSDKGGTLEAAAHTLLQLLDCRYVLVTRGEEGMSLFGSEGERFDVPAAARTVFDVSGAGDTVAAVLTLALAAGAPILSAVQLANFAAGAVVEKLGTATASADEIVALLEAAS
ncbi:MAG: D-glycero-beta-D-manno-heptose-7-phosphate kinase [Vulcanimicrobiaceae bacterium]